MVSRNDIVVVVIASVLFTNGWLFAKDPLVPGFGVEDELSPVLGFGAAGDFYSVRVIDQDRRTVDERFRRYDSNRDGYLSREELARNRWSDDPLFYDRNHDGRLSKDEMAVRYARRRMDGEADRLMKFYIGLDQNKNKMLEPQEYANNPSRATIQRRIREAGLDPSRPIPLSSFMSRRLAKAGIKSKQIKRAVKSLGPSKDDKDRIQKEADRLMKFYIALDKNGNKIIEPHEIANDRSRSTIQRRIREAGMDPSRPIPLNAFMSRRLANAGLKSKQAKKFAKSLGSPRSKGSLTDQSANSLRSYRFKTAHERLPAGVPDWFREMDLDRDGQVEMAEYSSTWTDARVAEFRGFDLNGDGFITPRECLESHSE